MFIRDVLALSMIATEQQLIMMERKKKRKDYHQAPETFHFALNL